MKTQTQKQTQTSTTTTRITVAVRDLRQILTGLGKVMRKAAPGTARGCVRFTADGSGGAGLAATGGGTWAGVRLPGAATGGRAEFLVPLDRLKELARSAKPADAVSLSPTKDGVEISAGTRTKVIRVPPASGFPHPPVFTGGAHTLPPGAIRAVGEALRCASTDKTRHILNGVHLDTSGKGHHIVGTDGRHLYSANSFKLPLAQPAILAANPLLDWKPIREAEEWELRTVHDKGGRSGSYEITAGAWRIIGELVDGEYPSWRQVVPRDDEPDSRVVFDPAKLAEIAPTLARLPAASPDGSNHPIVVRGDGKMVELLWKEAPDEPYQDLQVPGASTSGRPFIISIDRKYLAKAFAFGFGEMRVKDEMSPAHFSDTDGRGRQMIVMPLRMAGGIPPARPKPPAPADRTRQPVRKPQQKMPEKNPPRRPTTASTPLADPIGEAMGELAKVRDTLREAATGLQSAAAKLKRAKQEHRSTDKEIRSVRSTLESLRKVRL